MKRFTLKIPSSSQLETLRKSPIAEAYINSLPPRGKPIHGTSVDFFFENSDFSVAGEIVEDEQGFEESTLAIGATLGIEYWREEVGVRRGSPVIEAVELTSLWKSLSYSHLLRGPREVRLYTRMASIAHQSETSSILSGLELIAVVDRSQKILIFASDEGSPDDVVIMTASDGYEVVLGRIGEVRFG